MKLIDDEKISLLKRRFERLLEEIKLDAPAIVIKTELKLIIKSCEEIGLVLE